MAAQLDLPVFAINNFELLRFEHGLRADEALAMAAGKNDYFISLNSNYDNQETNFFSLEIGSARLFDFKANSAELIINYIQQYPSFKTLSYQELEPYYLREPSINIASSALPRAAGCQ
jgi:tRNA A37 threonylcarbamoyladenosine modification protein TsaB